MSDPNNRHLAHGGLSVEEWCRYWAAGNTIARDGDRLTWEQLRGDLAWAAQFIAAATEKNPRDEGRRMCILHDDIRRAIDTASSCIHNSQDWWDRYYAVDGVTVGETLVRDLVAAAMQYAANAQEKAG